MSRIAVVVNPAAGRGRAVDLWQALRGEPGLAGAAVIQAPEPATARAALSTLLERGIDALIVLGGDGTLDLVANVLLASGRGAAVAIGPVPLGTGSDFARGLKLPEDPKTCLRRILAAQPKPVDALEVKTDDGRRRFAINVVSAGISGLVDAAVNALVRRNQTAYLLATLGAVRRYRPVPCRIWVDGEDWYEGEILLLAVANGTSFGRGMKIAPQARVDDGVADVILVLPVPVWQLPLQLPRLYLGRHLQSRYVRWRRAGSVRLDPLASMPPFDVDGETVDSAAAQITLLPAALRILA